MFSSPDHPLEKSKQWKHGLFNIGERNGGTVAKRKFNVVKILSLASQSIWPR